MSNKESSINEKNKNKYTIPQLEIFDEYKYVDWSDIKYIPWGQTTNKVPDFHRENIINLARQSTAEDFQYTYMKGNPKFLKSISINFSKLFFKEINPDKEILITSGAAKAVQIIINTYINFSKYNCGGDEIIVMEPYYPGFFTQNRLFNTCKNFVTIPFIFNKEKRKLETDFKALESSLSEKSKLLILINPNNPGTMVYSRSEYEKITNIIEKYPNLIIIEVAVYFPFIQKGNELIYFSSLGNNFERTLTVFSGGKIFNTTGIRIGWIIGNSKLIDQLSVTSSFEACPTSVFEQLVLSKNLTSSFEPFENNKNYWEYLSKDIQYKFNLLCESLKGFNIKLIKPMGTYYCLGDVSDYRNKIPDKYFYRLDEKKEFSPELDKAFCRMILTQKIAFMPLSHNQNCKNKIDYLVRININTKDSEIKFLRHAFQNLKFNFI